MKYRYKDTEIIVESSIPLNSAMFIKVEKEQKPEPEKKTAPAKRAKRAG